MKLKTTLICASLVTAAVGSYALKLVIDAGALRTLQEKPFGKEVFKIPDVVGAEDIVSVPGTNAFIISSDKRWKDNPDEKSSGALYLFEPSLGGAGPGKVTNLTAEIAQDFHPHGIAIWTSPEGIHKVYAIDHRLPHGSWVVKFRFDNKRLIKEKEYRAEGIYNLNSLLIVDEDEFYATRDAHSTSHLGMQAERFLRLSRSVVYHFKNDVWNTGAHKFLFANGIEWGHDKETVVMAAMLERKIHVLKRDPATGELTPSRSIDLPGGPDNIRRNSDGSYCIGVHPNLLTLSKVSKDPKNVRAPTQLFRLHLGKSLSEPDKWEEIYSDPSGTTLSTGSACFENSKEMIVGTVYDQHFLHIVK